MEFLLGPPLLVVDAGQVGVQLLQRVVGRRRQRRGQGGHHGHALRGERRGESWRRRSWLRRTGRLIGTGPIDTTTAIAVAIAIAIAVIAAVLLCSVITRSGIDRRRPPPLLLLRRWFHEQGQAGKFGHRIRLAVEQLHCLQ